jgi:hypothetical protein
MVKLKVMQTDNNTHNNFLPHTKGSKKMSLYISELIRRNDFINDLKELLSLRDEIISEDQEKASYDLANKWQSLKDEVKYSQGNFVSFKEYLSSKYFLGIEEINFLISQFESNSFDNFEHGNNQGDVCLMSDLQFELLERTDFDSFFLQNHNFMCDLYSHPIILRINPLATKNEVLDYIEKNWNIIESQKYQYNKERKILKTSKHSQELRDFIWTNRELKITEVKQKLDITFPKNGLVYTDIYKILDYEKKRRIIPNSDPH